MKIDYKPNTVTTNATFDHREKMTLDEESLAHISRVLTNMYSKPAESVTREYAANGLDSHVLAGQTKPVEVTFPSYLNSSFMVKDYGIGMSREDLIEVYSKYGASTKRETNDQIGAFGLGAKSALALTNSFTVTAVKDGKRNVIIIAKDEEGGSSMNFLEEQDTDECNGVTVTVPVPNTREFANVERANIFVGWKPGTVLVNGQEPDSIYDITTYKQLGEVAWWEFGPSTGNGYGNMRAVVGPVSYEIPRDVTNEVVSKFADQVSPTTLIQRLVLNLPNGTVAITPNREELIFNAATKRVITDALEQAIPLLLTEAQTLLANASTRREAAEMAEALTRQTLLPSGEVSWRGETFAKIHGAGSSKRIEFTYANTELHRAEDDTERLYTSEVYSSYSNARGEYVTRVRHSAKIAETFHGLHRFALITEATRNKRGEFESNPKMVTWAKVEGLDKNTGRHANALVYTTTRKLSDLPKFLVDMAITTATAAEVIAVAKANAEPKAPRTPRPVEAQALTVTVPGNHRDKKDMTSTYQPEALDGNLTYIIAQATGPNGDGDVTFENAIYSYFRAPNNGKVLAGTESMIRAAGAAGYSFVILPLTANRAKIEAVLPNFTTIDQAFADMFTFTGDEAAKDYLRLALSNKTRYGINLDTAGLFEKGTNLIEQVTDPISRQYLALYQDSGRWNGNKDARKIDVFAQFYRNSRANHEHIKQVGHATKTAIEAVEALLATEGRIYPLLLNGIAEGAEQDAVDYINMIDTRRAATK